jgi:predicted ATPase/DNA-binding NarL/FixJ family response regulator
VGVSPIQEPPVADGDGFPSESRTAGLIVRPEPGRLAPRLPASLTSFVGRDGEVADVVSLLGEGGARLVTLTGPGGVGKTRLAVRVAEELSPALADGAVFVALASVLDPALVVPTVAHALGVRHSGDRLVAGRLADVFRDRELLLVLDNFEHVLEAAPAVGDLLRGCAMLRVLVTSRALLHVSGEQHYPVAPLPVPDAVDSPERLAGAAAVRLFAHRARAADPAFAVTGENVRTIAEICRRLDGLPLGLELAAARIRLLPPPVLRARLERRLTVLTGGARDHPARLRTMRDAVAWSHDLLAGEERVLFRRLAVFVGGFDLDAVEAVAAQSAADADVLAGVEALVEQSVVGTLDAVGETARFAMLETIRDFGLERLRAAGEEEQVRAAHAAHYLALAERAEPHLLGPRPEAWLARLAANHGNLVAALGWFAEEGDAAAGASLAGALREYWYCSGRWAEGRRWLAPAVARAAELPEGAAAKALVAAGFLAHYQGDDADAVPLLERGLALLRRTGDEQEGAYAQYMLGVAAEDRGDYSAAAELLQGAVRRFWALGDATNGAYAEAHLGIVALGAGDSALAAAHGEAARTLAAKAGSRDATAVASLLLGDTACECGDPAAAAARYREYVELALAGQGHGLTEYLARVVASVAVLVAQRDEHDRAARLLGAAERLRETVGLALALPERAACERAAARTRAALGEERFPTSLAEGRAMTPTEALAEVEAALGLTTQTRAAAARKTSAAPASLSPREAEILGLVAAGRTNREIADALYLSVRTVERHVTNLYAKIGARGRADATAFALRHGLA